jgi:hypothetical protein
MDMRMKIDQPRRDNTAGCISDFLAGQIFADRGHLAVSKGHVGNLVDILRRVDNPTVPENQIIGRKQLLQLAISRCRRQRPKMVIASDG